MTKRFIILIFSLLICNSSAMIRTQHRPASTQNNVVTKIEGVPSYAMLLRNVFSPTNKRGYKFLYLAKVAEILKKASFSNVDSYYFNYSTLVEKIQRLIRHYSTVPTVPIKVLQSGVSNKELHKKILARIHSWGTAQIEIAQLLAESDKQLATNYIYTALDNLRSASRNAISTIKNFRTSFKKTKSDFCKNVIVLMKKINKQYNAEQKILLTYL
jgi:hypothetical protein